MPPLKDMFNQARYEALADDLGQISVSFNRIHFLEHVLTRLDSRELMDRLHRTTEALALALPLPFDQQLAVLRALAPRIRHNFVGIVLSDFVACYGQHDHTTSLEALAEFTRYGSAEFAIRPFIQNAPSTTFAAVYRWAESTDEHVRRLASEGTRPRLPWGTQLPCLVKDPSPNFPILEKLKSDSSLYVRKSVANHLNDITKDHPNLVLDLVATWDRSHPHTAWIIKHALRTLVKRAHPRALDLLGVGRAPKLNAALNIRPKRIKLGDSITLSVDLLSTAQRSQSLLIDYVIHYPRLSGKTSAKVFKWKQLELPRDASASLSKRQIIRDFSTRKHQAGKHLVELQINGRRVASDSFILSKS